MRVKYRTLSSNEQWQQEDDNGERIDGCFFSPLWSFCTLEAVFRKIQCQGSQNAIAPWTQVQNDTKYLWDLQKYVAVWTGPKYVVWFKVIIMICDKANITNSFSFYLWTRPENKPLNLLHHKALSFFFVKELDKIEYFWLQFNYSAIKSYKLNLCLDPYSEQCHFFYFISASEMCRTCLTTVCYNSNVSVQLVIGLPDVEAFKVICYSSNILVVIYQFQGLRKGSLTVWPFP